MFSFSEKASGPAALLAPIQKVVIFFLSAQRRTTLTSATNRRLDRLYLLDIICLLWGACGHESRAMPLRTARVADEDEAPNQR